MSAPSAKNTKTSLGDLGVADTAIVEHVRCARPTAVRLMEMGLCRGTRVEVRRIAPLGDPMELFVSGYSLSIRRAEALGVKVRNVSVANRHTAEDAARAGEPTLDSDGGIVARGEIAMAQADAPPSAR